MRQDDAAPWLDVAGGAKRLDVTERFIRRLVAERRVRFYKVGRFVRFRPEDLDAVAVPVEADTPDFRAGRRVAARAAD